MSTRTTIDDASTETTDGSLSIAKDDLFHLLQNGRRRAALRYFAAQPEREEFDMRTLAEEIAAWENGIPVQQLDSDQRQRVYIALYQSHLPKLDDLGVIEYNQSRGTIEPTPLVDEVVQYLEPASDDSGGMTVTVPEPEQAWAPAAAAGGAVGVLILTAALAGLFPTSLLGVALATVVLGITAVVAIGLSWTE